MTSYLDKLYASLARDPDTIPHLNVPHELVYRVKWALEARLGVRLDVTRVEAAMRAEGMLPASEYGVPYWYRRKHLKGL